VPHRKDFILQHGEGTPPERGTLLQAGEIKILTGYRIKVSVISSGFFQDQEGKILKKSVSSVSFSYSVQWVSLFRTKNISNDLKDFWVSKVNLLLFKMFTELLHYYFMTQSQWVHYFMVLKETYVKDRQNEEPCALLASCSVCRVSHHTSYTLDVVSGDVLSCR
jgi:hypothetical protein